MKKVWFKKAWITGVRLTIVGLLVFSVVLIAYQSTLAQLFQRTVLENHPSIATVKGKTESSANQEATIQTQRFGKDDTRLAAAQVLKAREMEEQKKYPAAEELYREALRIDEKAFGGDSYALIPDLRGLGNALARQNKNEAAEAVLTRLIDLDKKLHGSQVPMTINDMTLLAGVYIGQKKFAQAEKLLNSCLAFNQERFGRESLRVAIDLSNFSELYIAQGNEALALNALNRAVGIAARPALAVMPDARRVKTAYNKFWDNLTQKYIANAVDSSVTFPYDAFEQAGQLKNGRNLDRAEAVLKERLDSAVKASAPKTELAKYLVRLSNVLYDRGKDEETILWASIAGNILNTSTDSSLLPWKINARSYMAMSFERLAARETLGRKALLASSAAMYESAIRLSSAAGSNINDKWRKLLNSGRESVKQRLKLASQEKGLI